MSDPLRPLPADASEPQSAIPFGGATFVSSATSEVSSATNTGTEAGGPMPSPSRKRAASEITEASSSSSRRHPAATNRGHAVQGQNLADLAMAVAAGVANTPQPQYLDHGSGVIQALRASRGRTITKNVGLLEGSPPSFSLPNEHALLAELASQQMRHQQVLRNNALASRAAQLTLPNRNSPHRSPSTHGLPNEHALLAELAAQQLLQQQLFRSNALASASQRTLSSRSNYPSMTQNNMSSSSSLMNNPMSLAALQLLRASASSFPPPPDMFRAISDANTLRQFLSNAPGSSSTSSSSQSRLSQLTPPRSTLGGGGGAPELQDLSNNHLRLLQQLLSGSLLHQPPNPAAVAMMDSSTSGPSSSVTAEASSLYATGGLLQRQQQQQQPQQLDLPPCDEGPLQHFTNRPNYFPLGSSEDANWLSEFHCFVRSELIEVFRASREDCRSRNNSISYLQAGLRCRFCAHVTPASAKAGRSSAFPSSVSQIYQSFTMMLRDHFPSCESIPRSVRDAFLSLKDTPSQGATDSKRYWVYSAMKIGMHDSPNGIVITKSTLANGYNAPPFGTDSTSTAPGQPWPEDELKSVPLVLPEDRPLVSDFQLLLLSQAQVVRLLEAERIGNRRNLPVGLPGFGCRYCCDRRRLGHARMFPARRRTVPAKVKDLHDHLRRCTLCPSHIKEQLERAHVHHRALHATTTSTSTSSRKGTTDMNLLQSGDREFYDRVWSRLGHDPNSSP